MRSPKPLANHWVIDRLLLRSVLAGLMVLAMGSARGEDATPALTHRSGPIPVSTLIEQAEQQRIDAIDHAIDSAVSVFIPGGGGGGSGVVVSPAGYALTNFHVTSPAGTYMQCGMADGNIYDAVIVGIDPVGDLAMIRLLGLDKDNRPRIADDFTPATIGSSRRAQPGDWCMVIGNPFLLASNLQPTVTWGILSGVGRYQYPSGTLLEYGDCLQTDASVNPGNSGGPIYDARGNLLGIVGRCSFEKRGRVNVGVGYAISINQAQNFLGQLHSGRIVDHATLGATVATDPEGGVRVTNILESSDAYRRGIRYGSEILEIDGRIVQTANDLQNVMATFPADWRVKIRYRDNEETRDTVVRLRSVHLRDELLTKMAGALPPPPPRKDPQPGKNKQDSDTPKDNQPAPPLPEKNKRDGDQLPKRPPGHSSAKGKIPKLASEMIQEREGYANYYFNRQLQSKFIDSLRDQFPMSAAAVSEKRPTWTITGSTNEETPKDVRIIIGDETLAMIVGERSLQADGRGDVYDAISAGSIGGIVAALDGWRQMLIEGPSQFGDTYYWGTLPLAGERPLRDCVVGIDGELELRFLSHPTSKALEVVEAFADRDEDPAELWIIRDGPELDSTPSRIELRYGTASVLSVNIQQWNVQTETPQ